MPYQAKPAGRAEPEAAGGLEARLADVRRRLFVSSPAASAARLEEIVRRIPPEVVEQGVTEARRRYQAREIRTTPLAYFLGVMDRRAPELGIRLRVRS